MAETGLALLASWFDAIAAMLARRQIACEFSQSCVWMADAYAGTLLAPGCVICVFISRAAPLRTSALRSFMCRRYGKFTWNFQGEET